MRNNKIADLDGEGTLAPSSAAHNSFAANSNATPNGVRTNTLLEGDLTMNRINLSLTVLFVLVSSFVFTKDAQMAIVVAGLQPRTQGAVTVFSDKSTFLSATCAKSATGPLPSLGYVSSAEVGSLTFSNVSGSSDPSVALAFGINELPRSPEDFWTTLLPGVDLAVSGFEDVNIVFDGPTNSFGFDFAEHMTIPSEEGSLCGGAAGCTDSIFTVSLFLDGTPVDSFSFNAPNDVASFVGVSSAAAFNRAEIRESRTQGGMENDYYGQFYVGDGCECVTPPPGMISWWPGDGNAIDIAGANHGTLLNGAALAPGMVGQAFSFDGVDDFVEIPEDGSFDLNGDFTIDAWVKPNDLSGSIPRPIVSKYSFAGQNWQTSAWELSAGNDGKVQFGVTCGTTTLSTATMNPVVSVGEFAHVAAVYRQSVPSVEIYVDGVLQAVNSGGTCTVITQNDIPVRIGMRIDAAVTTFFTGLIDEVEIFDRPLSASEIQSIFNAGSAGKCKNRAPVAVCQDVTVTAGSSGTANASIDNGSFDPDGDPITITQSPEGPYAIGQTTVRLTVEDNDHASSSCQAVVAVLYNFDGFFHPVDNPPIFNLANAGSAIPMKFSLHGNQGLDIFAASHPASQQIGCSDGAPVSTVEEIATAGNSGISYDVTTDQYTYVWKTDKSWKGRCRQLILKLNDSSVHVANFQFR